MADLALLITSVATLIGVIVTAVISLRGLRETRTGNALTLGQAGNAAEARRVEAIPHDQRTVAEQAHLDDAPEPGPAQGPG